MQHLPDGPADILRRIVYFFIFTLLLQHATQMLCSLQIEVQVWNKKMHNEKSHTSGTMPGNDVVRPVLCVIIMGKCSGELFGGQNVVAKQRHL